jgi:hypothetical protein
MLFSNRVKPVLASAYEGVWRRIINEPYLNAGRFQERTKEEYEFDCKLGLPTFHLIPNHLRKVEQCGIDTPMIRTMLEYLREVAPLAAAVKDMGGKVVKRQPKPVEDRREKYLAPRAGSGPRAEVQKLLFQITDAEFQALKNAQFSRLTAIFAYLEKVRKEHENDERVYDLGAACFFEVRGKSVIDMDRRDVLDGCYEPNHDRRVFKSYTPKTEQEVTAWIEEAAHKAADEMRQTFISKQLSKLDNIVERKGHYRSGEVGSHGVDLTGLYGEIQFNFEDGSSFKTRIQVVDVVNSYGTRFIRVPVTYHNVIMPDGKPMASPSEKRMIEVFAGGRSQ